MKISEIDMISPNSLEECLSILNSQNNDIRLLAGGTDAVVRMKDGVLRPTTWINIKRLKELRFIREHDDEIHIGPLTTYSDIIRSPLLQKKAPLLVEAAKEVGAVQIQNMGTIGGNIGTASPAGDTLPVLHVFDAKVELTSLNDTRMIPIDELITGPGKTVIKSIEIMTNIVIKPQKEGQIGIFEKLGPRKAQSISIVNMAAMLTMGPQPRQCLKGKIAFGSVGPTIIRGKKCEAMLPLKPLDDDYISNIADVAWKEVMPISDVRASAGYRRDMASSLLARGLYRLMKRWDEQ